MEHKFAKNQKRAADTRPFVIAGYAVILLTFGVAGGWAATAKLDRGVIASGTIDVSGNRKEIQHLEGGLIDEILVQEGQTVEEGQLLVKLNDVQARTNLRIPEIRLHIAQAMEARLLAERRLDADFQLPASLLNDPALEVQAAILDQREIFSDRRSILKSQTDILRNRIDQLRREYDGLDDQRAAFQERVQLLEQRLNRLRTGFETGVVQANILSTYEDEYMEVKQNVARMETEKAKTQKSMGETEFQILQTQQQFKERASSEYKDISGQIKELVEHVKVAQNVAKRTEIRSPVKGAVQNIRFHTTGGVIRPGEVIMEVIPITDSMVINAHVSLMDIDNVRPDLKAEIKFTAFPGRFMPIIIGKVENVSKSSIVPPDGKTSPYYLARINVSKGMVPDDIESRISAGMPAEVIISTGERTVADYLISPLTDAIRKSMREE